MSKTLDDVFSLRIVVADFYLCRPTSGLDPSYSDFRGHRINSVPIIRIFGSNSDGKKTCLHVHGVFPYFYIPYENTNGGENNGICYQIASSLDKALNISLGQGGVDTQHVFKVQPVKGIPFYGYHRKEHQFLKIFLYNPRFIRRAANLFQSGAILGRTFQPHESHVPYVLQFFIDFNLYGMSFLHAPKEVIKFRMHSNHDLEELEVDQLLNEKIQKVSISEIEVDIAAGFILNRFQANDSSDNLNPGIEAIWQEERLRRNISNREFPAVEIAKSQDRHDVQHTESDIFYKNALNRKLNTKTGTIPNVNAGLLSSSGSSNSSEKKRMFNLKSILANSVYPSECSQEMDKRLLNASTFQDHLSADSVFHSSVRIKDNKQVSNKNLSVKSMVDEDLLISSQTNSNQTLHEQDFDLLDIMQQLEEGDYEIDMDSTLAPLSQISNFLTVSPSNKDSIKKNTMQTSVNLKEYEIETDSDDDILNNYTLAMEDLEEGLEQVCHRNSDDIIKQTQIDGADDMSTIQTVLQTPKRRVTRSNKLSPEKTPKESGSPRYLPLQIKVVQSPQPIKLENKIPVFEDIVVGSSDSQGDTKRRRSSRICRQLTQDYKTKTKVVVKETNAKYNKKKKSFSQFEKSFIACTLRGRTTNSSLKFYNIAESGTVENIVPKIRKCKVRIKRLKNSELKKFTENSIYLNSNCIQKKFKKLSPCDLAQTYDRKNNFFPEPGPSHIDYYKLIKVPNPQTPPVMKFQINQCNNNTPIVITKKSIQKSKQNDSDCRLDQYDNHIHSFYEKSFLVDSQPLFSDDSPALTRSKDLCKIVLKSITQSDNSKIIIIPKELAPNPSEVHHNLEKFGILDAKSINPFFSDASDAENSNKREIGHKILHIRGNSLNDCDEFQCSVMNLSGIYMWRKHMVCNLLKIGATAKTNIEIKEYLADKREVVVRTLKEPPSRKEAKIWIKACELMNSNKKDMISIDEDESPIKVKREKIKMILEDEDDVEKYLRNSQKSLAVTPLTAIDSKASSINEDNTENNNNERVSVSPSNINSGRSRNSKVRLSLLEKFAKSKSFESNCTEMDDVNVVGKSSLRCVSVEKILKSDKNQLLSQESNKSKASTTSEDTDEILKLLENSSFANKLNSEKRNNHHNISFGLTGATLNNTYGFKVRLEDLKNAKADIEHNYLTIISLEVFVPTRNDLKPNPEFDEINCIFYSIVNNVPSNHKLPPRATGYMTINDDSYSNKSSKLNGMNANAIVVDNEAELFNQLIDLCKFWDPDILAGYEIEMSSWGYVMDRAKYLNIDIISSLSRVPTQKVRNNFDEDREQLTDLDVDIKICGRILLDVWRLMRSEIALTSYTYENVMYHILHRRCPLHSYRNLTTWYNNLRSRWIVIQYYVDRVKGTLNLLDQLDLVGRTCEMAKLFGIQFYEVLSRGSQFRVESMMLRMAKPKNLIPVSPSVQQRAHMKAPEYLPLILEPDSRLYTDPVIVLDFQSLYPSMIIAYNYCFSTCLGRVEHLGQSAPFEFGASQLRVCPVMLKFFMDHNLVNASPCGVVFVKPEVRHGILPKMLSEILDTRLMVKQSMKIHKSNSVLQRVLHSRQLGLKLIANVTYGYTAANFSGRMPSVEVGDSVVSKGRETLERAIKLVEANKTWRAKVVYGDTDSLFVLVPGRSRQEAFRIGAEIAELVSNTNPKPVKLKLEKVYQPCILQTKKRYVGFMYESTDQKEPIFEAKGIETVRRDGCPAVAKMLEKCLRILFSTCDVSQIKRYVCRQFTKILSGRANVQDLIFAKEFRGKNGYKPGACVPALELTRKWLKADPRNEPRRGERVPFIITNGPPGVPLIRLVCSPHEYLSNTGFKINAIYYITKAIIPPLNRCLQLIGANVHDWFVQLPRKVMIDFCESAYCDTEIAIHDPKSPKKSTISQYFSSTLCVTECGRHTKDVICEECRLLPDRSIALLSDKILNFERGYYTTRKICESCCGRQNAIDCESLECPVLFVLNVKAREHKSTIRLRNLVDEIFF